MSFDSTDIAWAAGFLEGEGSFFVSKYHGDFRVSASQTHTREPLEKLQQIFGGSIGFQDRASSRRKGKNQKDAWQWMVVRGDAFKCAGLVLPFLSKRRQEQALSAMSETLKGIDPDIVSRISTTQ